MRVGQIVNEVGMYCIGSILSSVVVQMWVVQTERNLSYLLTYNISQGEWSNKIFPPSVLQRWIAKHNQKANLS